MTSILFSVFNHPLCDSLAKELESERGELTHHFFPDGESCIQIHSEVKGKKVILVDSLDKVNQKIMPLILASETLRELGANDIILCSPYLAYMRQDKAFQPGQGISARYFAKLISTYFDGLITIDPHLHRIKNLKEVYTIPAKTLHAGEAIANWIKDNIKEPLLIGPDSESRQWVEAIAKTIEAPFMVLEKIRRGDKDVEIKVPNLKDYQQKQIILVDDIISSAGTMIEVVKAIHKSSNLSPLCIAVHALFSKESFNALQAENPLQL